jgi:CelD/BcsL family acetyltransferase involved in cellulose biosynthesis
MQEVLKEQQRPASLVHREERALLSSVLSPEDYLDAALSTKKRKELRRQHRRLSEAGDLQFERRDDALGVAEWVDAFLWLEAKGWKGKAGSAMASEGATTRLLRSALEGAAARGRLERLTLTLDGIPIAMLANFIAPPGAFAFKTAFDEDYARFSPGVLLQRENLGLLERPEIDWCDSCATADHPMIDHFWRERRSIGRVSFAIGGRLRRSLFRAIAHFETRGVAAHHLEGLDG